MRGIIPSLLAATALVSPALALDACKPTPEDSNVRVCVYNPNQRYVVRAPVGFPVNIRIGDAERIKRTDFAYTGIKQPTKETPNGEPAQTWKGPDISKGGQAVEVKVDRYKTNLPIWAFQEGHSSLVLVTVAPDGTTERPYQFDLTALPKEFVAPDVTTELSFVYPDDVAAAAKKDAEDKKQAAIVAWRERSKKDDEIKALERLKVDVFYGKQNKLYRAKGDPKYKSLAPKKISDNGFMTQMQWPGNMQIPTIAVIDPATGEPRTLTPTTQGPLVVINGTYQHYRLWLGHDAVLDILNKAWRPERDDPRTGTSSPEAVRSITYRPEK